MVVAAGEGHLVCLEVGEGALREAGHVSLGAEARRPVLDGLCV